MSEKLKSKVSKILGTTSLADIVQINRWWERPPEEVDEDEDEKEEENKDNNKEKSNSNKKKSSNDNDDNDNIYNNNGVKWKHLEHNGVLFPPEYEPHNVKLKYKGEPIDLNPEQEEIASFWGQVYDTDFAKNPIAIKNFTKELKSVLPDKYKEAKLSDFDFADIKEYYERRREKNKSKTTEEKKEDKKNRQKMMDYYGYAICDGSLEKIANFLVEPPGLFRGRGEQPLTGSIKRRTMAEDVTLNVGPDDAVPICPQKGHSWGEIVSHPEASWLAYYKVRKNFKYVFLASNSKFKGMSDYNKYEKAKKLKNYIGKIREDYYKKLEDKNVKNKQLGVATYLIDRLALRVGNEKGEDEADTVGCCTIRVEHINLEENNYITFDFLAKDSMRYLNTVQIDEKVYKNLQLFVEGKDKKNLLFDEIKASTLNDYLKLLMPGLSAKVFRTFNASMVLQDQLSKKVFSNNDTIEQKVNFYNEANKRVAELCNHQRTVPKNFETKTESMKKDVADMEEYLTQLNSHLSSFSKKGKAPKNTSSNTNKEGKSQNFTFPQTKEKTQSLIESSEKKLKKLKEKLREREAYKNVALGTSKLNYMDPRITVSWCKKNEVPIEKIFSKSIRDKFPWAMYTGPDYSF